MALARQRSHNKGSEDEANSKKLSPEGLVDETFKCEHTWPTPADMAQLKGKPRSEWVRQDPFTVQEIDFYLGRMPEWYIEEKFLKNIGDYLLSRGHNNKLRLSVKSSEPGNPVLHFPIEFCQTKQVRGDRNYYYRLEKTVLQNRSVWGLIESYRTSTVNSLKINTKRDVQLITAILPCQGCRYSKTEYSFMNLQIRDKSEINIGELLCKGKRSIIYKATRYLTKKGLVTTKTERPVILKEFEEYSEEILDTIFRELHIVHTIRHQIGWDTALNVEAVVAISQPYYVAYKLCTNGSLLQYLAANTTINMKTRAMVFFNSIAKKFQQYYSYVRKILQDVACTLHHCQKLQIIHGNLRAKNVFVDIKEDAENKTSKVVYYVGGYQYASMGSKSKKVDPTKVANKRWLAPEVFTTKVLTPETDVFAFAYLMYEVMTLEVPFPKIKTEDILEYIARNPEARPPLPPTIPQWMNELISDAWSAQPAKRPTITDIWRVLRKNNKQKT